MKDNGDDQTTSLRGNPLKGDTGVVANESRSDIFEYTFPNPPTPRLKPHPFLTFFIWVSVFLAAVFVAVAFSPYGVTMVDGEMAIASHQPKSYHFLYSTNINIRWVGVDSTEFLWIKIRPILMCLLCLAFAFWWKHTSLNPTFLSGFQLKGRKLTLRYVKGDAKTDKVFQIPRWGRARVDPSSSDSDQMRYGPPVVYVLEAIGPFYLQIDTTDTYYGVNLGVSMKKSELKALANQINAYLDSQVSPSADQFELPRHRH